MSGRILIVTGTTGSGKTTSCQQFVADMDDLWLHFGVDLFLGRVVPRKFIDGHGPRAVEGVHMVPDDPADPDGPWHMELGRHGMDMIRTFHRMAAAAVRNGQNVIMDHIATIDPPLLQDLVATLGDLPAFFVGLKPPTEVIPRRIDERLESIVASLGCDHAVRNSENKKRVAHYLHERIFAHDLFDLVVDSDRHPPKDVVRLIADAMGDGRGQAIPRLAARMAAGEALTAR